MGGDGVVALFVLSCRGPRPAWSWPQRPKPCEHVPDGFCRRRCDVGGATWVGTPRIRRAFARWPHGVLVRSETPRFGAWLGCCGGDAAGGSRSLHSRASVVRSVAGAVHFL